MLLAALAFVLAPLMRTRSPAAAGPSGSGSNLAVFRSQKREIEEDFTRGALTASERDQALAELSRRLLDEVPAEAGAAQAASVEPPRPWALAVALGILIPLVAAATYAALGTPRALEAGALAAQAPEGADAVAGQAPMSDKQILAMVDALAQKMQQNPDDPKGWILLARSQNALGRYPEAAAAFERAVKLVPNDAQLFADYADALLMAQEGRFDAKSVGIIRQALKLDGNNLKALALMATAELRAGNRQASLQYWGKMKTLVLKGSDDDRQIDNIIAEIQGTSARAASAPTAPPAASATEWRAASGVSITGQVALAPGMAERLAPGDTLFVLARAKEGPRMPLAVMRIPAPKASEFPQRFELNDAMAMAPGMNLSAFPEVVIEARISKSGNAQLQPGDVSGLSGAVKPGATGVVVTLSKVAP